MNFYQLISLGYDELYGEEQRIKFNIIKENLKIKKDDLLLDVGCGTGISSNFGCKVIGLEPSLELIKQNKTEKILARAENIPFKNNVFDKVVSITSMHNFDDIGKGIREMKRVGKNEFAFSILKKSENIGFIEKEIKENFKIKKIIDGKKDWIYICKA